ncbi:MAG: hypothetical protein GX162_02395 [Firmicutes bacterium]|nr:hypothetical protein [Bacillota bacterium]
MWLFAGPFFIFLGIGFFLGVVYLGIRYGIPFFFEALRLGADLLRQVFGGFWAGLTGNEPPKSRL